MTSGRRYWQDGSEVAGQQFDYRFDDIGNRDTTGGRASAVSDYTANRLNQYSTRTVPAYVDMLGLANPTTNVTVNGNVASRKGEYFHHPLNVPNSTAQYPTITVTSQYGTQQSDAGEVFVPAATEGFGHDLDGNLTSDGRWTLYTWDGENRLIEMMRDTSTPTLSSRQRLVFEYDAQGRRIRKQFYTHNGTIWVKQRDTICLYDGWNVVAELDANGSNAKLRTYVWGSDLSGTLAGAGGVGGLLWLNNVQTSYDGQTLPTGVHFVAYDGNGNVLALLKAADGSLSARYEYGPFGEPLRWTGALAEAQPFRFSTKWTDAETGLLYYGYRYYNPTTGRWLSRDPIEERGGVSLLVFVNNSPIRGYDSDGRLPCGTCGPDVTEAVRGTFAEVDAVWEAWNNDPQKRKDSCYSLLSPLSYAGAWVIPALAFLTDYRGESPPFLFAPPAEQGNGGTCATTVVFESKCYQARDVHYLYFGKLFKTCNQIDKLSFNRTSLTLAVTLWKRSKGEKHYTAGALAFALAGYDHAKVSHWEEACRKRPGNKAIESSLDWHWWPHCSLFDLGPAE